MNVVLLYLLIFSTQLWSSNGAVESFSYLAQSNWSGVCTTGLRQSPVNIISSEVSSSFFLAQLYFTDGWTAQTSGIFENTGTTVKFTPTSTTAAITTFLGTYDLQQFHMHWGYSEVIGGSEHTINERRADLEIHFVHYKRGANNSSQGDYAAVIGVLADVGNVSHSGAWSQLDVAAIKPNTSSPVNVMGLVFNNLLPENRSYYYYMGSLTTPPCSEIVQWFLLKEKIKVPQEFLNKLRLVRQPDSQPLLMNFRDAQLLGSRVVIEGSQSFTKPVSPLLLVAVILAKLL